MTDQTVQTGGNTAGATGVVVDKNKSNEQYIQEAESIYIIPNMVREKFPDLVKLIYETESMNEEEREYWMQILPIMSEDQIVKFREILVNEKEQLSRLDQEYNSEMSRLNGNKPEAKPIDEEAMKQKFEEIKREEKAQEAQEKAQEEDLLKALDNL